MPAKKPRAPGIGCQASVAEPEGLVSAIDNLLLFRCVQIVRRLAKNDRKVGIFCNIALGSLGDESFFPQFLEFLSQNRDLSGARRCRKSCATGAV